MRSVGRDGTGYRRWLARAAKRFRHDGFDADVAADVADEAQIVRMHLEEQYTFEEISQRMDCHTDSVRKVYQRAIARLRRRERHVAGEGG
ncbi:MAG: hypothetical protein K6U75_04355 [Firmicutes bacterium]|nr:hypothetical protein [Bacillota bacterium]